MSFRWVVLGVLLIAAFLLGRWSASPPGFLGGALPGARPEAPESGPMQPRGLGIESPDYVWNEAEVEALEFEGDIASLQELGAVADYLSRLDWPETEPE